MRGQYYLLLVALHGEPVQAQTHHLQQAPDVLQPHGDEVQLGEVLHQSEVSIGVRWTNQRSVLGSDGTITGQY